jgi:simple sugar transport system permease protein
MSEQTTVQPPEDELVVRPVVVEPPVSTTQRYATAGVLVGLGLITIWLFALRADWDAHAKLRFGALNDPKVHQLSFPSAPVCLAIGIVIVTLGLLWLAVPRRRWFGAIVGSALGLFVVALLCWMSSRNQFSQLDLVGLGSSTIQVAVPLILGALCGVMCERSGVINVAIEGQMLAGAWTGALVGTLVGSLVGIVGAALAGALMGWILAVFAIRYLVNQVVLGVVLNVFAAGLTGFFYDAFMQPHVESLNQPALLDPISLPLLSKIPILGPLLFEQSIIVYITYVLIVVVDVWLFRTRWGLRTRAVGEHPKAADTVGINVLAMRYRNVIIGGAIAGIGGAYFTFQVGQFQKNITSGYGFIALAAVIFGRWSPRGAVGAALLFGFATAMQTTLSINVPSIPSDVIAMLPYLATIFAVAGLVGKVRAPAADGEPYVKE